MRLSLALSVSKERRRFPAGQARAAPEREERPAQQREMTCAYGRGGGDQATETQRLKITDAGPNTLPN